MSPASLAMRWDFASCSAVSGDGCAMHFPSKAPAWSEAGENLKTQPSRCVAVEVSRSIDQRERQPRFGWLAILIPEESPAEAGLVELLGTGAARGLRLVQPGQLFALLAGRFVMSRHASLESSVVLGEAFTADLAIAGLVAVRAFARVAVLEADFVGLAHFLLLPLLSPRRGR